MSKTTTVRARMEPALKREAETVLSRVGLSSSEAINLFFHQVALHRGLPFPVSIPNAESRAAIASARAGKRVKIFKSAGAWAKATRSV